MSEQNGRCEMCGGGTTSSGRCNGFVHRSDGTVSPCLNNAVRLPNPTPAREAVASLSDESAMELAHDLAEDCIVVRGEPDVDGRTVGEIVGARVRARLDTLLTAARADERAQLAAARERAIEEAAALCDKALKAAAEVLHLAGRIRALAGRKGEG